MADVLRKAFPHCVTVSLNASCLTLRCCGWEFRCFLSRWSS